MALVVDPTMKRVERTPVLRIAHPWVDLVNKDVPQVLADCHDLVPRQWLMTPVQKTFQPNAEICCGH
jgi:hypothetical protein